ncbi:MAG: hypothetical protein O9277_17665 [Magnetospirillum sp.]|jgi:hypothetical protein|nr:hypothetical protein [Magnetospirillum sp.]
MSGKPYTIFMLIRTTTNWLSLDTKARFAFVRETIGPILAAHPTVRMRFFDSEFFSAQVSDVVVWETVDLFAWRNLVDRLRETPFWGTYFDVTNIIPSVENSFADTNDAKAIGG